MKSSGLFYRVLDHSDDESDRNDLHGDIIEMPNREHAIGIRSREPPATPDAPQADRAARRLKMIAVGIST